jgi:UDP-2-acetamido-2-deoxy-ribo-hexuluronate aminotransferase
MEFIDLKSQQKRIRKDLDTRIAKVLDHGQYILGPEINELEQKLAQFVGVKHCISNSNGTDALLLPLMAAGIGCGDEVITTPFTFFATGEMITLAGAKPVFVDIDPNTYNIDAALIEKAISSKTKAIMPVSLYGQCADFDAINEIANKNNLLVIEDGAQSFGAEYKGKKSCSLSHVAATSFFPSKPLGGYGDSGACFTNDDTLAKSMKELRVHGQEKRYYHTRIGINGRMDTMQAAILLSKLDIFPEEVELRKKWGEVYKEMLGPSFKTQLIPAGSTSVYAQFTIEVDERETFIKRMSELGVPTAVHYPIPLHLQPVYASLGLKKGDFPLAEKAAERVVSLPMHPYLDEATIEKVVNAVKRCQVSHT